MEILQYLVMIVIVKITIAEIIVPPFLKENRAKINEYFANLKWNEIFPSYLFLINTI